MAEDTGVDFYVRVLATSTQKFDMQKRAGWARYWPPNYSLDNGSLSRAVQMRLEREKKHCYGTLAVLSSEISLEHQPSSAFITGFRIAAFSGLN